MKRILTKIFSSVTFFVLINSTIIFSQGTGFVVLDGKQFKDENGNNFFPKIMNYGIALTYNTDPPPTYPLTNIADVDFNPNAGYGSINKYENSDGLQQIRNDFQEMKYMGFNTVRLITGLRRYNQPEVNSDYTSPCDGVVSGSLFTFTYFLHGYSSTNINDNAGMQNVCFAIQSPYSSDPLINSQMSIYLNKLEEVLDIAEQEELKVILLTGDGWNLLESHSSVVDYIDFLKVLTTYFSTNSTIMAYDIHNEPGYKDSDHGLLNRDKQDICSWISEIYEEIKNPLIDPNHLITMGLGDHGTTFTWDPGVMKLDFVALHFYPEIDWEYEFPNFNQQTTVNSAIDRYFDLLWWASNHLEKPWVLEETGFMAKDPYNYSLVEHDWFCYGISGSVTDQENFIADLLPEVKNCGMSGFAWWGFQDEYDHPPSHVDPLNPVCDPLDKVSNEYRQRYWSLINPGDPSNNLTDYSLLRKPGGDYMHYFDWSSIPVPCIGGPISSIVTPTDNYFNPFNHPLNSDPSKNISGQVIDQEDDPVKGAVVFLWTALTWQDPPNDMLVGKTDLHYTFTNNNGEFLAIPFDYLGVANDPDFIQRIYISAQGAERLSFENNTGQIQIPNPIVLRKLNFDFNGDINDVVVDQNSIHQDLKGWNTLSTNAIIESGVSSNIYARKEVNLTSDFWSKYGSDVHVFVEDRTFFECSELTSYEMQGRLSGGTEKPNSNNFDIELNFNNSLQTLMNIYPNPSTGFLNIELKSKNILKIIEYICIYDISGRIVKENNINSNIAKLNLNGLLPGIYIINVKENNNSYFEKLILN